MFLIHKFIYNTITYICYLDLKQNLYFMMQNIFIILLYICYLNLKQDVLRCNNYE